MMSRLALLLLLTIAEATAAAAAVSSGKRFNVSYSIAEETDGPLLIGDLTADLQLLRIYSAEELAAKEVEFLHSGPDYRGHFTVRRVHGVNGEPVRHELTLVRRLDRELVCPEPGQADCHLTLSCMLKPYDEPFKLFIVRVVLLDVNDHSPTFDPAQHTVQFSESDPVGTRKPIPHATDADSGRNARVAYELEPQGGPFRVDSDSQTQVFLALAAELDREHVAAYEMNVTAADFGERPRVGRLRLRVTVSDANDCFPVFDRETYAAAVVENSAPRQELLRLRAEDNDEGENGRVKYHLVPDTPAHVRRYISIGTDDGRVVLERSIDREELAEIKFQARAVDGGVPAKTSVASVHIRVLDLNDGAPQIELSARRPGVLENRPRSTVVTSFTVKDDDLDVNGSVQCRLDLAGPSGGSAEFEVKEYDAKLKVFQLLTRTQLDREVRDAYPAAILCTDGGGLETRERLTIIVEDDNDHAPRFLQEHLYLALSEDAALERPLANLSAVDDDIGDNGRVSYFVTRDAAVPETRNFEVGKATGILSLSQPLDREQRSSLTLLVVAHDNAPSFQFSATVTVFIEVRDVNDVAPVLPPSVDFSVEENGPPGIRLGPLRTSDPDLNEGGRVTFYGGDKSNFGVTDDGHVVTRRSFDRELRAAYTLRVFARDHGSPSLTSSVIVTVHILDRNDCPPQFIFPFAMENYSVSVHEPPGYLILQAVAKDRDEGDNGRIRYSLAAQTDGGGGGVFSVAPDTGKLQVSRELRPADLGCYRLDIRASDCGVPRLEAAIGIYVTVEDIPPKELFSVGGGSGGEGSGYGGNGSQTPLSTAVVTSLIALTGLLLVLLVCVLVFLLQRRRAFSFTGGAAPSGTANFADDDGGDGGVGEYKFSRRRE